MYAEFFTIKINMGLVVDGPEVEEIALARMFRQLEDAAIPDRAFIILEFVVLGIPVAGDLECGAAVEIVFDELTFVGLFFIVEETTRAGGRLVERLVTIVVVAVLVGVYEVVPAAIE